MADISCQWKKSRPKRLMSYKRGFQQLGTPHLSSKTGSKVWNDLTNRAPAPTFERCQDEAPPLAASAFFKPEIPSARSAPFASARAYFMPLLLTRRTWFLEPVAHTHTNCCCNLIDIIAHSAKFKGQHLNSIQGVISGKAGTEATSPYPVTDRALKGDWIAVTFGLLDAVSQTFDVQPEFEAGLITVPDGLLL